MIKEIAKPLIPAVKWLSVAAATAAVVVSIQVSADDQDQNGLKVSQYNAIPEKAALLTPSKPWSPASGFADLIESVNPAVVHVSTSGFVQQRSRARSRQGEQFDFNDPRDFFRRFFEGNPYPNERFDQDQPEEPNENDGERETRPLGIGSGFIISQDGYVVTNHHVIDRADEIVVTLPNGEEYDAEIKGSDPKTDLALLKLANANDLPYVPWGDDKSSRVGDWVLAIGNPFGLGGSASTGIISALGRDIRSGPYDDFIQVDAAINRGNSGGPLFNMNGEVIGINSMIYSPSGGSVGIGFAIPASLAQGVVSQLRDSGEVQRSWIGVEIGEITEDLAKAFERENQEGALVSLVRKDSPAQRAGLEQGDIILSFNGKKISEVRNLPKEVAQSQVGKTYPLEVWRNGKLKKLKIKTEAFPSDDELAGTPKKQEKVTPSSDEQMGAELTPLNDELRAQYRLPAEAKGVLVLSVERNGLAAKNGIRRGVVIEKFHGIDVRKPSDVSAALKEAKSSKLPFVPMLIRSSRGVTFIAFKYK
ncbi:DegQ family serine endoprotease [Arenicella sp. 4NH20-0111]|uniref:DegQ family serine endoprotease n=1 Tax=Arenicella sp. 4NH20-0111 TaxID=3127648 RepID=UPI003102ECF0